MVARDVPRSRRSTSAVPDAARSTGELGFTLVEILIAIVLVGILSAVVVLGIGQLTNKASTAACATSADASRVASTAYFASTGTFPTSFADLTSSSTAGGPALVLATGTTAADRTITAATWTLTMSATTPPTYTCSTGGSSATVPPPTVPPNGVTAKVGNGSGGWDVKYYGEDVVTLSNTSPITALSVTIVVVQTAGLSRHGQYTNFGGSVGSTAPTGSILYTFDTLAGQTLYNGPWVLDAQYDVRFDQFGVTHVTSGDTWSVTSTSGGITNTISGTF